MNQQTIDAVNMVAGRVLSDKELIGVQSRIEAAFHDLEAEDPATWHALPDDERASRASELATTRLKAAVLKEQQQTIAAMAERFGLAPPR